MTKYSILVICMMLLSLRSFSNETPHDAKVFSNALDTYEKMHSAFFKNSLEDVKKLSKTLSSQLNKLEGKGIKKTLDYTNKKVSSLENATDLESAHKMFNVISQGFLMVLEKSFPKKPYGRYYCPMVKKYWIQNTSESEKVMNPYASDTMPHCGGKME